MMTAETSDKKSEIRICAGILESAQVPCNKNTVCHKVMIATATFDKYAERLMANGYLVAENELYLTTAAGKAVLDNWRESIKLLDGKKESDV